jgi:hypothetical protein
MSLPVEQRLQHRFLVTEAAKTELREKILRNSTPQTAGLQPAFSGLTTDLIVWWSAKNAQHSASPTAFERPFHHSFAPSVPLDLFCLVKDY